MAAEAIVPIENRRRWKVRAVAPWVAGALIGMAAATLLWDRARPRAATASIASLVAASKTEARTIEPRLSGGFPWAPFHTAVHDAAPDLDLAGAIRSAVSRVRAEGPLAERHAAGLAHLLAGRHREALAMLAAAEASNNARMWSDLAAASYAASVRYGAPEMLADALAAADSALALEPELPEALFNRALIIERLGLRDDAREAWNRYLRHESDAEWEADGRAHLSTVAPFTSFKETLARDGERVDPALARSHPEEARSQGLMMVLGRWADAETKRDHVSADRHLRLAREFGAEIARFNGDRMLERAVAVIDRAGETSRAELAAAHRDYSAGVLTYWSNEAVAAEPLLKRAIAVFERNGSPVALMGRFYAANAVFDQGRRSDACVALKALLAPIPADYPACRAHVLSQLGACRFAGAKWGESMRILEESAEIFDRLGEVSNAAAVRRLTAMIYDRTGDRENAWKARMVALRAIGRESNLRLEKAVSSIAHESMLRRSWRSAMAFLNLEIEIARRVEDEVHLGETLALRAAVRRELKDVSGARADLADARTVTATLKDAGYRTYLENDQLFVEAMLTFSPFEANAILTTAIAFQSARGDRMNLPGLLLQRARALRRGGDSAGATADLARGIAELESSRESLPLGEARWGAFHAAGELFEEAIDLAIEEDDVATAFAVAEKARARSLLEEFGCSEALDTRLLPPGMVIVEYAALPDRLVIFTASSGGVDAVSTRSDRDALARDINSLLAALQSDSPDAKRSAAALHRRLIEPVATRLLAASKIVFVPDAATAAIPFAALVDRRGEYLVESHGIVVAPSAAVFAAADRRRRGMAPPRSSLVIANAAAADQGQLAFVAAEAAKIGRMYAESVELQGGGELRGRAAAADVIHFAGHAIGDASGLEPASIVLRSDGADHRLGVTDISTLPLRRTAIVVLAGCSTARGARRGTEGVISVAHGFLTAGAPSVIATLWNIEDKVSAQAFPRLHAILARGVAPAEALRALQLECIRRGDVPPSLWAALQVIGS